MKKILCAVAAAFGIALGASAQEFTFSYGGYTQMDAVNNHKGFDKVNKAWGAVNFGLYIPVTSRLAIGPSYTYSSAKTPSFNATLFGDWDHSFNNKVGYHALLLNAKYRYYSNSIVKLYAHVGVGAVIANMQPKFGDSFNKGYFAGQISPIGAEVNLIPHFDIFGELGFGPQGLVQIGGKYTF